MSEVSLQEGPSPEARLKRFVYQHVEMAEINSSFFVCEFFKYYFQEWKMKIRQIQYKYRNGMEIGRIGWKLGNWEIEYNNSASH